jgi:hypothetical protein
MTIRPRSIRAKLLLVSLAAAALPIAVLGVVFYGGSTRAVAEMVGNRTERIARNVRAELDARLTLRIEDRLLSVNEPVQSFLARARQGAHPGAGAVDTLGRYLDELFAQYGEYYEELVIADDSGEPRLRYARGAGAVVSDGVMTPVGPSRLPPAGGFTGDATNRFEAPPPLPTIRESDRSFFHLVPDLAPGEHLLRADPVDPNRGQTVSILLPVQSNQDRSLRLGYLLARVRSRYLWPDDWANRRFGEKGHLVIFDESTGKVLYHTRPEWIGSDLAQLDPELLEAMNPARAPRAGARS